MNLTVLTSITGGKDRIIDKQEGNAEFVAYLDHACMSDTWRTLPCPNAFTDPRRNSRIPKILASKFVSSEYSLWIDGNIRILKDPEALAQKYLKDHDIAVYKHPQRDCIYDEAKVCAMRMLDDPELIIAQAKAYEDSGYAKHKGLNECGIIFRRHTPKIEAFENEWWAQYTCYSRRDQISFMYAVDKIGLRVNSISDFFVDIEPTRAVKQSGDFEIVVHQHPA